MNAKFEITVGHSLVGVKILRGREMVRVFVNDVEQNATEYTCKFINWMLEKQRNNSFKNV